MSKEAGRAASGVDASKMAELAGRGGGGRLDKSITLPPDEIFRNLENAKRFAIDIGKPGHGAFSLPGYLRPPPPSPPPFALLLLSLTEAAAREAKAGWGGRTEAPRKARRDLQSAPHRDNR